MDTLIQDLKYSARALTRNPGFAIAAVVVLAIAIGANTVVFSAFNAVLLHPFAFSHVRDLNRLVVLYERNPSLQLFFANRMPPRPNTYRMWKEQAHSFEELGAWQQTGATITDPGSRGDLKPAQISEGRATTAFFSLLGIRPVLGRGFTSADMQAGKDGVGILGNDVYKKRFSADPHVIGTAVLLHGKPFRIIGVLPATFRAPALWGGFLQEEIGIWTPLNIDPGGRANNEFNLYVYARL
jgi:putative ABC transport system permease protein